MSKPESGLKSIAEGRSDIYKVDPRKLNIKPSWNSRDFNDPANVQHINELALSISEIGVQEPLTVYWEDGKAWVEDGECRLRAVLQAINVHKAPITLIPVKVGDRYANEADRLFSQKVRNSGKPFTVLENAKLYKRLLALGWSQQDIAKKEGVSPARVSQILDFNTLPEGVKAMVLDGNVAPSTAMAIVKAEGSQAEKKLKEGLKNAKAEGKNKVQAKHIEPTEAKQTRVNVKTAVIDAFEYADINDEDSEIVVIKMPAEKWEVFKNILKL